MDSADPIGEWQTLVTGEGEQVSSDGGEVDNVGCNVEQTDDDQYHCDPAD